MRKSSIVAFLSILVALAWLACTTAPYTGRKQLVLLTESQEA